MLHIVYGGAGCGKSEFLMHQLKKDAEANKIVRTMVPEQFAFTYDKRLYALLGAKAFNLCRTGSFRSLTSEVLASIAAEPRDAADDVVKTVVLHRILQRLAADHALRFYGGQADKPAFFVELQTQLNELMQSGATPEQLADAASHTQGVLPEKILDIARVYADYLDELEQRGLRDTLRDTVTAAAAADGCNFLRGCTMFLDEYESFTGDQYIMLDVILRSCDDVWIALRTDHPDAPDYSRFDAVNQTCRRLRRMAKNTNIEVKLHPMNDALRFGFPSLAHLSRHILTAQLPAYQGTDCAVTVCEARDATLEAEYTAASIRRLLMNGTAARDIMVVTHDLSLYGALLEPAFERYDIPFFMDLRRSVLHTAVMKLPLCLLQLAHRTTTEQILLYLKTQLSSLHPAQAAALENYAFTWDIDGEQWERPFAAETDPEGHIEQIRQQIMDPILKFRARCGGGNRAVSGAKLCEALYLCMDAEDIPMRVGGLAQRMKDGGDITGGRALRRLWNRFTELLDALHDALAETDVTPLQLADLLTTVLRGNQIPVPPQMLDAVTVQSAAAARYDAPQIVFVLGVNEGAFPADIQSGGFFSEQERAFLAEQGVELSRSVRDLCADERLIVCKTLAAPSQHLYLSYPLSDECGNHLNPSSVFAQIRQLLPNLHFVYADDMGADFYVSTKAAAYYSFVQDYAVSKVERETVRKMLENSAEDAARLERLRRTSDPTRLRVSKRETMRLLTGDNLHVSQTQIENTMQCPFKAFCANGLKLYLRKKQTINAMSVGNLVHYCMEQLFLLHPDRDSFLAMTEAELQSHANTCAADFLRNELGGENGRPQRFLQQYERLTHRMTALLLHTQAEMRQSKFSPDACELVIGKLGDNVGTAPYQLRLANGMTLTLNGKIDRVDLCELDGQQYLRIVDYKTGAKEFTLADIYYGLNLQMLLYLFALLDDESMYADAAPAGVLYMPANAPKPNRARDDAQSLAEYVNQYFRMSGTVLCDRGILSAMEENIAGVYIPAQLSSDDTGAGIPQLTKDSQVFTTEQLSRLRGYVEELVAHTMQQYAEGEITPSPMVKSNANNDFYVDACRYCDYRGICGVDADSSALCRVNDTEKNVLAEMQRIMDGEEALS